MSFPFGGHPTLEQFIEAAQAQGCSVEMVFVQPDDDFPYQEIEITNPNGGRVIIADVELNERLTTSVVTNLERRLGIKTKFAGAPDSSQADD